MTYMDGYLKSNLKLAKQMLEKDYDLVFVVDGYERAGKSVLAMQMAHYLDPSFDISRMCFSGQEFRTQLKNAKSHQAVVFDEAMNALFSRTSMSKSNIDVVRLLAEVGQKNLFIIIVLPSFFVLDLYAAIHRSRCLLHVYTKGMQRGFFKFYSQAKKKNLYLFGKKGHNYGVVTPNFIGRFANQYPIDEEEYRKKKAKMLTSDEPIVDWRYEVSKALHFYKHPAREVKDYFNSEKNIKVAIRTVADWWKA